MAGKILTVAQQKGGAGKTTVAAHLAVHYARSGKRVGAVDIDPQGSLTAWAHIRGADGARALGFDFASVAGWRARNEIDRMARALEAVIVDSPPHAETEARIAIRAASLVIVPVQPSPLDVWALEPTLEAAKAEKVSVLLVLNRVPPRAAITGQVQAALRKLNVPVAWSRLGQRVHFASSLADGRSAEEVASRSLAAAEARAVADEVWQAAAKG